VKRRYAEERGEEAVVLLPERGYTDDHDYTEYRGHASLLLSQRTDDHTPYMDAEKNTHPAVIHPHPPAHVQTEHTV